MGYIYAWATPDYILDRMSLEQLIIYYRKGVEALKTDSKINWGVLGQALSGEDSKKKVVGLDKFKENHPDAKNENGAWKLSR